jgi:hypothetical protein
MRYDQAQLSRTLDLWAAMWQPRERVVFERALERVLLSDAPDLKRAAIAACHIIGTPRLLAAVAHAVVAGDVDAVEAAAIASDVAAEARVMAHAARFARDRDGIGFLLSNVLHDPGNRVADKLLDRVDIRDLWALLQASDDDAVRTEAARRIARRGPHQRARLCAALGLTVLDDELAVDVPIDDLVPAEIEVSLDDLTV